MVSMEMKGRGLIDIIRPVNCLMMGIAVVVGEIIASSSIKTPFIYPLRTMFGFLTGFFLTASSMVINDYVDREIDMINQPQRPIPSGALSPRTALAYSVILATVGLATSIYIGIAAFLVAISSYAVAVFYNVWGKKTGLIGNLMVSYTVMIPLLYGSLVVNVLSGKIIIFSIIIFLANTGREITKGIVDVQGDRVKGVMTLAVKYGLRAAASYAFSFYASAIALSIIPYIAGLAGTLYLILVLIVDIIIGAAAYSLYKKPSKQNALRIKRRVLYAMLLGLVAFAMSGVGL